MPAQRDHIAKAEGNESFARSLPLDSAPRIDWALIALFYGGMHYVEAYLARTNVHLRSHTARDYVVGRDAVLKRIFREYQDLKFYGYNARYEAYQFTHLDVTREAIPQFLAIKNYIRPLL